MQSLNDDLSCFPVSPVLSKHSKYIPSMSNLCFIDMHTPMEQRNVLFNLTILDVFIENDQFWKINCDVRFVVLVPSPLGRTLVNCHLIIGDIILLVWAYAGNYRESLIFVNTLRPRQNGRCFAYDTFKCIFLNENVRIFIEISLSLFLRVQLTIFQHWFR